MVGIFNGGGTVPYGSDRKPIEGGSAINFGYNSNCPYWVSGSSTSSKWSKYTSSNSSSSTGKADNKTILELEDDAAHVHLGGDCRMPTETEIQELIDACNTSWVTNYNDTGINGRLFTLKSDPSKTLFFPASGCLNGTSWSSEGSYGACWSSSLHTTDPCSGKPLRFSSSYLNTNFVSRYYGHPVRVVLPPPSAPPIEASKAEACDVVFAQQDGSLVIRRDQKDWKDNEVPIGIVVIPAEHGVLKDGDKNHCGVMSIVGMDCNNPTSGGTSE